MTQITTATNSDLMPIRDVELGETRFITYGDLSTQILSGASGGFQFSSGTSNPPVTAPTDPNQPALYYNTSTKFTWNWNIGEQAWVAVPKVYRAVLTQSGTNAPTVVVLENTLGDTVVWSRDSFGVYFGITNAEVFTSGKTFAPGGVINPAGATPSFFRFLLDAETQVSLRTFSGGASADSVLYDTAIEILVYP